MPQGCVLIGKSSASRPVYMKCLDMHTLRTQKFTTLRGGCKGDQGKDYGRKVTSIWEFCWVQHRCPSCSTTHFLWNRGQEHPLIPTSGDSHYYTIPSKPQGPWHPWFYGMLQKWVSKQFLQIIIPSSLKGKKEFRKHFVLKGEKKATKIFIRHQFQEQG